MLFRRNFKHGEFFAALTAVGAGRLFHQPLRALLHKASKSLVTTVPGRATGKAIAPLMEIVVRHTGISIAMPSVHLN